MLVLPLLAPLPAIAQLFELHRPSGEIAGYLLGSMHSNSVGGAELERKVVAYARQSQIIVMETADNIPRMTWKAALKLPGNSTFLDSLSTEVSNCVRDELSRLSHEAQDAASKAVVDDLQYLHPFMFALTYYSQTVKNLTSTKVQKSLDSIVVNVSAEKKAIPFNLETPDQKLAFIRNVDLIDANSMIKRLCEINSNDERAKEFSEYQSRLMTLYAAGDMDELTKFHRELYSRMGLSVSFASQYWTQRNLKMGTTLSKLIKNGYRPFVAIGASHLGGEDGVLRVLAEQGISALAK